MGKMNGFLNNIITQVIAGIVLIIFVAIWGAPRRFIWKVIKNAYLMVKKQTLSYKLKEYTKPLEERISKLENEMRLLKDTLQQRFYKNMTEINTEIQTGLSLQKKADQKIDELNGKFIEFEEKAVGENGATHQNL